MKKIFKILADNSGALLIFITIVIFLMMIYISMDSNKKSSENLFRAVELYINISEKHLSPTGSEIETAIENFSGRYFGWGNTEVETTLEMLDESQGSPEELIRQLIRSYQKLIRTRMQSFDTLFFFLFAGVLIQFIFLLIITYRARAAGEKLNDSREILKLLNLERERERLRISSMLHDSILQDLGGLLLSEDIKKSEESSSRLRKISGDLREMTYRIAPLQINTSGLKDAAEELIRYMRSNIGSSLKYSVNGYSEEMLGSEEKIVFYRILQESLNNIRRHSQAKNAEVTIVASYPFLIMRIRDDGTGFKFPIDKIKDTDRKHMGLLLMDEQAKSIGAVLSIESNPGKGTSLILKYSLKAD